MAEQKIKWTDQQKRAIVARGSDVLVTASAGTGKTAVLSGRCVDIVADKSICPDVWSILVLTFTDMAAEQMRSRIAEQLTAAFSQSGDQHLWHQLILLQGADISTIHSFCKRVISEYFYKLGLDPTFSVIDADEAKLLKAEVLEKTIDWAWQQSNLQQALQHLLYRRDLRTNYGFLAKIIELNDFLDGMLFRENWYDRASQLAEIVNPFTSELGEKQKQIIADRLQQIRAGLCQAQKLYRKWGSAGDWAAKFEDTFIKPIDKCIELLKSGDWDRCADIIRTFSKPRVTKPKELPTAVAELIQRTVKKAVDSFVELSELAILNPDYLDRLSSSVSLQTKVLVELVKKFGQLYSQAKSAFGGASCLDFADLERYALKLLTDEDSSEDNLIPSETALALRRKYKYIFVDEFQDINPVQQAILDAISSGGNILEVGDVKQSIYAFRGAEPEIFLKQLKHASIDPKKASNGLRVDLNINFRSAKGILDFVNKIFSRIMRGCRFAGLDYDESAQLRPAAVRESQSPDREGGVRDRKNVVEFHIVDEADKEIESQSEFEIDENFGIVSSRQRQAAMIAQRIKQIVGAETGKPEFQIYDNQQNKFRDVEYRDIVILMRSLAKKANDYVEVLRLAGVPVSCQATAGYFETTEIADMLCLLKVLDNPQRDIELAAVLRSPFFKISDTELAKIKIHSRPVSSEVERKDQQHLGNSKFWNCVLEYSKSGADAELAGKLKEIMSQIEQWRTVTRRGNLADLVWQVYRQTHFLSFVSALPNGQARRANLLKLHDRAIQFEGFATSAGPARAGQLSRFVEFIEKLQEAGQDWAPAEPQASAGNAVRILSVHKSKGLEFSVVFLAELDSKFNKKDIYADILADASDTLGLQIIDRKSNSRLRSLAHEVIAEQKLTKALAEEMRILYVATTRARDRLILTASQKRNSCRDIITNGLFFGQGEEEPHVKRGAKYLSTRLETGLAPPFRRGFSVIPEWQLRACQSPLEWVLYALSDQKALHETFETELAEDACDDNLFSLKLYNQVELKQLSNFILNLKAGKSREAARVSERSRSKEKPSELLSQVKRSLGWQYRHGDVPLLPAKQSVTQLTHRNDEYVRFDYSRVLERQLKDERRATSDERRRAFGTATHLVISQLDLTRLVDEEAIQRTKEKLLADAAISEAVAETIETDSILAFFQSDLGRMALDKRNTIWREWPFTFALPASLVVRATSHESQGTDDDFVVVQGIIDMLVRTPQGLVVIDFKTDNITAGQVPQRAELYRQQLELYARAASKILKEKLLAKWLYFLTPATEFEIK